MTALVQWVHLQLSEVPYKKIPVSKKTLPASPDDVFPDDSQGTLHPGVFLSLHHAPDPREQFILNNKSSLHSSQISRYHNCEFL